MAAGAKRAVLKPKRPALTDGKALNHTLINIVHHVSVVAEQALTTVANNQALIDILRTAHKAERAVLIHGVESYLKDGASPNSINLAKGSHTKGWSALHIAVQSGVEEVVEVLIRAGAEVNAGYPGETPLAIAIKNARYQDLEGRYNYIKIVKILLWAQANIRDEDFILIEERQASNPPVYEQLNKILKNIAESEEAIMALYNAVRAEDSREVKALLGEGVSPIARIVIGGAHTKILDDAIKGKIHESILDLLRGQVEKAKAEALLLQLAAAEESTENMLKIAELLAEGKGADPNVVDKSGYTALHRAVEANALSTIAILLNDPRTKKQMRTPGPEGKTALDMAIERKCSNAILAALLQEVTSCPGDTLLHLSARAGHVEAVKASLAIVAVGAKNSKGQTALDVAKEGGHTQVIELIEPKSIKLLPVVENTAHVGVGAESGMELAAVVARISKSATVAAVTVWRGACVSGVIADPATAGSDEEIVKPTAALASCRAIAVTRRLSGAGTEVDAYL